MGHFKIKAKNKLEDLQVGSIISESDFATLTPSGEFVQLEYIEDENQKEPYKVKPGIWAIKAENKELKLLPTSFVNDKILDSFVHTSNITDKIDCFFRKFDVYKELGIEVPKRSALLYGPAGCHAKGTEILLFDGSIKKVEDIRVGDQLMGPDSTPRNVLSLANGREKMLKVIPTKGKEFIVNYNHIFHLTPSNANEAVRCPINIKGKDLVENVNKPFLERFKLTRTGVNFQTNKELPIDPYILGLWLGDGTSKNISLTSMDKEIQEIWSNYGKEFNLKIRFENQEGNKSKIVHLTSGKSYEGMKKTGRNKLLTIFQELELINNKHIPQIYLTASKNDRLKLLAGLIDTDGHLTCNGYEISQKNDKLTNDIIFLARSLGFAAYNSRQEKLAQTGNGGIYNRISISGDFIELSVKLEHKKAKKRIQIKNVLRTGFKLEILPEDDYYGFSLDKDHLYLTSDFTIHHNTGKTVSISVVANKYAADNKTAIVLWHTDKYEAYAVKDFIKSFEYIGVEKLILVVEDIGGIEIDEKRMASDSSLLSLLDNKEKTFTIPVFILATTNYPANFMGNLTNRPERFDDKIEVGYPKAEQRKELLEFFLKENPSQEAKSLIVSYKANEFSAAHIREVVIRSKIYDKTIEQVIEEMYNEIELYKKGFENRETRMGF